MIYLLKAFSFPTATSSRFLLLTLQLCPHNCQNYGKQYHDDAHNLQQAARLAQEGHTHHHCRQRLHTTQNGSRRGAYPLHGKNQGQIGHQRRNQCQQDQMNACRDIGDRRKASILNQNIDEEDNGVQISLANIDDKFLEVDEILDDFDL